MTKDELIDSKALRADNFAGCTEVLHLGDASRIMEQYAEQRAVAFGEWLSNQGWELYKHPNVWCIPLEDTQVLTTAELYALYSQSLNSINL
jgi:hypothetical protein